MSDGTTDYEIDIRSIDTEYTTTLPRDVNKKIDPATTLSLRQVTVTVKLSWRSSGDHYHEAFEIPFRVDHTEELVEAKSIGDAYGERESLRVQRVLVALGAAERAVAGLLSEISLPYSLRRTTDRASVVTPAVAVHTAEHEITAADEDAEVAADD